MKSKETSACVLMIISMLLLFSIMFFNVFIFINNVVWLNIILYTLIGGLILLVIFGYVLKKDIYFKLGVVGSFLLLVIFILYFVMVKTGVLEQINSFDDLKQLILGFGGWGLISYMIINLLQCLIIPIPTTLTVLVGTAIYGPTLAFLYACAGVIIGSSIAFLIGRYCSRPVINWIFGEEKVQKYQNILNGKTSIILFVTLLLPLFPDDLICMMAGVSEIKYRTFLLISLFARGIGLATLSFLGSGQIIPFSGWGIAVWCVIGIGLISLIALAIKNKNKLKKFFHIT